ncbi:MAG: hypothetical protein R6W06_09355 [Prochlorococcaceae cyanobacterium]
MPPAAVPTGSAVPLLTVAGVVMVVAVVALVAWALQLMQAANDRQEFSLMLAGCMVCSAAVGLATVMVITLTNPAANADIIPAAEAGVSLDAVRLPFDDPLECLVNPLACTPLPVSGQAVQAGQAVEAG